MKTHLERLDRADLLSPRLILPSTGDGDGRDQHSHLA